MTLATAATVEPPGRVDALGCVRIRPTIDDDRAGVVALFQCLSAEARVLRFLHPATGTPAWAIDSLARVSDDTHAGLVALAASGRVVGVGQLFHLADDPTAAELAITVAPSDHRRGIGRRLLRALAVAAMRRGLDDLTYVASPMNRPAIAFMRSAGARSAYADGLVHGRVEISTALLAR